MITAKAFAGKHYGVLGLARSGLATVEALLASGAQVSAWDENADARAKAERCSCEGRSPVLDPRLRGDTALPDGLDSLVVSPGVPLNRHPIVQRAREAGVEIIGDIELFARARPELPPHKVVGITGTNGKSTTTALVHHILKTAGVPTTMGGNIGLPILSQNPLPEGGVYVLELSSYQIDLTQSLDCDVAVLLNITPDHLDRYESFEAYAVSKMRLFTMQSSGHLAVISDPSDVIEPPRPRPESRIWHKLQLSSHRLVAFDVESYLADDRPALRGPHNAENVGAAHQVCRELGLDDAQIWSAVASYPGLPHRMERVRERDGVLFVNDSKATNPTATAPALAAFSSIRWILGGQAKADNLDECAPHFGNVRSAYVIGEAAALFERLLSPHMPVKNCGKLAHAVRAAAADSVAGDTVLLSPACASFDQFRDFEDRGDQFKGLVGEL